MSAARAALWLAAMGCAVAAPPLGSLAPSRAVAADVSPGEAPDSALGAPTLIPPDSTASLHVETLPSGLLVFLDGDPVGRSPVFRSGLRAGRVRVRVLRDDPRRLDRGQDVADVELQAGDTTRVVFDLRPPVAVETVPYGAEVVTRRSSEAGDSLLGGTPLALPASLLPDRRFRFHHPCCADTALEGSALLGLAREAGTARITLRPFSLPTPVPKPGRPIYRRRWVQWGLLALGAGLTGTSALLKREGDRWYDRYLGSSDRRLLDGYFDRAVHYDHLSLAALGTGQVLFTGGLVLLLSHSSR